MNLLTKILLLISLSISSYVNAGIFVKGTEISDFNKSCSSTSHRFEVPPFSFITISSALKEDVFFDRYLKCPINIEFNEDITFESIALLIEVMLNRPCTLGNGYEELFLITSNHSIQKQLLS